MISLNKLTKVLTFLIFLISAVSCSKESPAPEKPVEESGFLKTYFAGFEKQVNIQKTTESTYGYEQKPTSRGYMFMPLKDIQIVSVGAMIAEKGKFKISLCNSCFGVGDVIDSLIVTDTNDFTYKKLATPITLKANTRYTISYFSQSHNAVYDAFSPQLSFPLSLPDLVVQHVYHAYYTTYNNRMFINEEGLSTFRIMRGLVDFKYLVL